MTADREDQDAQTIRDGVPEGARPVLDSLLRKAAVDAGFDLEPEIDEGWWRLRASGAPGIAWVRSMEHSGGAWLALSLAEQLSVAGNDDVAPAQRAGALETQPIAPRGAAAILALATADSVHAALHRVWTHRAYSTARMQTRWENEVASALEAVDKTTAPSPTTEVVAEVRRRVGQDLFREALLEFWQGRCAVTGLDAPELLRASHAKPWADATDSERLDVHNGFLLAVHFDALFDRGFLTFDNMGRGVWSPELPDSAFASLGLTTVAPTLRRVCASHQHYLTWHREHVFRG